MSFPLKFRLHVLKIKKKEALTYMQAAERFQISVSTLVRWNRDPKPIMKRNKGAVKIDMKALEEDVKKYPDAYQRERAVRLGVSKHGIFKALRRLGVTYKKKSNNTRRQTRLPVKSL